MEDNLLPSENDMMSLLYAEVIRKGLTGHHINSMNTFYKTGLSQIFREVFIIEGHIANSRTETEEDQRIKEISFEVRFLNIELHKPSYISDYGVSVPLLPARARTENLTYSINVRVDVEITAIATYHTGGQSAPRKELLKNVSFTNIPCCVGSELCHKINMPKHSLIEMQEDPLDCNGYFIIEGKEYSIDNLENIAHNNPQVFKREFQDETARLTFLSRPGDSYENSYQIILRKYKNGGITVELNTGRASNIELPFFVVMRLLGVTTDTVIFDYITQGNPMLNKIVELAYTASYTSKLVATDKTTSISLTEILNMRDWEALIKWYVLEVLEREADHNSIAKDENIAKFVRYRFDDSISRFFLPHEGTKPEHNQRKAMYLGHLLNWLINADMTIAPSTDRDNYKNKRVHSAGVSLAKSVKTVFNMSVVQPLKSQLKLAFTSTPFSKVNLVNIVEGVFKHNKLETSLIKSIVTGNKTMNIGNREISNRVSSQIIQRKNDMNMKSTLNVINTSNTSSNKKTDRSDEMRRVHPSYIGYIDVSQSADTGEKVGMVKEMAISCSISGASVSYNLRRRLLTDPDIITLDKLNVREITPRNLLKVFVNGYWVGCVEREVNLAQKYRELRRAGEIDYAVSISQEIQLNNIYLWCDYGRVLRPLIIVYNNLAELRAVAMENAKLPANAKSRMKPMPKFRQWVKLTQSHIDRLKSQEITMDDLRKEQIIEYISADEQENMMVAYSIYKLNEDKNEFTKQYTHCDIEQAIFGPVLLASPLSNNSNTVRNTFFSNHRKQSTCWYALNQPYRWDKNASFQHYGEYPLVSTFSDNISYPNGHNAIVALAMYGGFNVEDSIVVNGSSVDCGMFNGTFYNYMNTELEPNEEFMIPDPNTTTDIKHSANNPMEGHTAMRGSLVGRNALMIAKVAKLNKAVNLPGRGDFKYADTSILYPKDELVRIENSVSAVNAKGKKFAKVRFSAQRPFNVGDKLSSREGNKGICAVKYPREDMPYCEDGLIPDLIVNPHSIPTRMAISQIIECVCGILALKKGQFIDKTAFKSTDIHQMIEELNEYGISYGGHRRMYNGRTGEWFDSLIFVGPTTYQRLQKYVVDEHYATGRSGHTSALTRQAIEGKSAGGSLRCGEMEKDTLMAQGVANQISEKFHTNADGIKLPICRNCGRVAIVNTKISKYRCKYCNNNADISYVESSWAANLLANEISSMLIDVSFDLEPVSF